jgi:hypothetical protein
VVVFGAIIALDGACACVFWFRERERFGWSNLAHQN